MAEIKHETRNKRATLLGIIGVILVIIGAAIVVIHNPLRGTGIGSMCLIAGIVLLIISMLRFNHAK